MHLGMYMCIILYMQIHSYIHTSEASQSSTGRYVEFQGNRCDLSTQLYINIFI